MIAIGAVREPLEGSGRIVDRFFAQLSPVASFLLVRPTALPLLYKFDCACFVGVFRVKYRLCVGRLACWGIFWVENRSLVGRLILRLVPWNG